MRLAIFWAYFGKFLELLGNSGWTFLSKGLRRIVVDPNDRMSFGQKSFYEHSPAEELITWGFFESAKTQQLLRRKIWRTYLPAYMVVGNVAEYPNSCWCYKTFLEEI